MQAVYGEVEVTPQASNNSHISFHRLMWLLNIRPLVLLFSLILFLNVKFDECILFFQHSDKKWNWYVMLNVHLAQLFVNFTNTNKHKTYNYHQAWNTKDTALLACLDIQSNYDQSDSWENIIALCVTRLVNKSIMTAEIFSLMSKTCTKITSFLNENVIISAN